MADQKPPAGGKPAKKTSSPKIREHALAVLRETRAKIDPALLSAMKEKLSALVPGEQGIAAVPPAEEPRRERDPAEPRAEPKSNDHEHMPLSSRPAQPTRKPVTPLPEKIESSGILAAKAGTAVRAGATDNRKATDTKQDMGPRADGSEPVDRQKVAKIVMEYMRQRQEKSTH